MTINKARPKNQAPSAAPLEVGKSRILVVEDEPDIREMVSHHLRREGFVVTEVERGEQALRIVQDDPPDLIVLDLMLPGMDGLSLCRAIKADRLTQHIPIVMMTARGEETDIVIGLEMGADDYVTKPFSARVLMARLKAVLRRPLGEDQGSEGGASVLRINCVEIIPERHEVRVNGTPIELTAAEFRLLHLFAKRPGRVFTRQQIIDQLHDGFAAVTDRSVDVQVVALRRKLADAADMVQTIRGVGYRLRDD